MNKKGTIVLNFNIEDLRGLGFLLVYIKCIAKVFDALKQGKQSLKEKI